MKPLRLSVLLTAASLSVFSQGCGGGHYYRITDPKSGDVYYTRTVDRDEEAAGRPTTFVDARTGRKVALDRLDIDVLRRSQYRAAVSGPSGG